MAGSAQVSKQPRKDAPPRAGGNAVAAVIALAAALAAGAAGQHVAGAAVWGVAGVLGLLAAVVIFALSNRPADDGDVHARREVAEERRTASAAVAEVERLRRQVELAAAAYRDGKDPLTEIAELRVGPLRDLLQAAKDGAAVGPVVSRLPLGEEELVGVDGEPLPEPWPVGADDTSPLDPRVRAEARRGLDELIRGLTELAKAMPLRQPAPQGGGESGETPAQLVDAVVQTAADGIEDLAAGLMRANELASVAERVTNRATLLALNAALEATRSGSEAFAAIAEETRKLAEFAREATDKISLLANEIECKVGETITAIHATSEHAKSSLGGAVAAPRGPAPSVRAIESLLTRAEEIRKSLSPRAPADAAPAEAGLAGEGEGDSGAEAFATPPREAEAGDLEPTASHYDVDPEGDRPVENAKAPADKNPTDAKKSTSDFLMLEGLEPGATYRG